MPPVIKTNPKDIADIAGVSSLLLFADTGIKSFQKKRETKKALFDQSPSIFYVVCSKKIAFGWVFLGRFRRTGLGVF